jgi:hypothetical protein
LGYAIAIVAMPGAGRRGRGEVKLKLVIVNYFLDPKLCMWRFQCFNCRFDVGLAVAVAVAVAVA